MLQKVCQFNKRRIPYQKQRFHMLQGPKLFLPTKKMGNDVPMPCQGYDISGHDGCPHGPGACLEDEQLFLGICYAKCNLLTGGEYPYRVGPMTCCRKKNELDCLSPFSSNRVSDTSSSYDIAGGGGDRDRTTPGHVHAPLQFLTEEA